MEENIHISDEQTIKTSLQTMNQFPYGSKEYEYARRMFAWVCSRIRQREKTDEENLKKYDRVGEAR